MSKKSFFIILLLLIIEPCHKLYAQVIIPEENTNSQYWTNILEYIFVNTNSAFRTYDFTSYEWYNSGFSSELENNPKIFINGLQIHTNWSTNGLFSMPNFNPSDLDSIVINNKSRSINFYTRSNVKEASIQAIVRNQVYDPGILDNTEHETFNVERVNENSWGTLNVSKSNKSHFLAFNTEKYSRTGHLSYDKKENNSIQRRTFYRNADGNVLQYNIKNSLLYLGSLQSKNHKTSLLFNLEKTNSQFTWEELAGLDVPFKMNRFQIAGSFELKEPSIYKKSLISFSKSKSDSLENSQTFYYDLEQVNASHSSHFELPLFDLTLLLKVNNELFTLKDFNTFNDYMFIDNFIEFSITMPSFFHFEGYFGNTGHSISVRNPSSTMYVLHEKKDLFKTSYGYHFWTSGIGFSKLNDSRHSIINNSSFEVEYTELQLEYFSSNAWEGFSGYINYKHFWSYVNQEIQYFSLNNKKIFGSQLNYFDSDHVGIISFYAGFKLMLSGNVYSTTMFSGNLDMYGNNEFKNFYKSVPKYVFSEIIKYKLDKNFNLELSYRYIPARRIIEYEVLESENEFPYSRVKPISLLNFSTTMWFFDRRLETKLTLRNLFNKAEAYDTNGQYYYMSTNVSARINFGI